MSEYPMEIEAVTRLLVKFFTMLLLLLLLKKKIIIIIIIIIIFISIRYYCTNKYLQYKKVFFQ